MSDARKFKFVSPGIFLNEIDQSQIPALPENVGPVLIGRSERGPGMIPTKVSSFSEFVEKFGNPIPGRGAGTDVWRAGNYASPTYAAYAAQAYLKAGVGPVTYVRLMGTEHPDAAASGRAGWKTTNDGYAASVANNGGPYGLLVWKSGSAINALNHGTLAAVWYLDSGAVVLTGSNPTGSQVSGASTVIRSDNSGLFKAIIYNDAGSQIENVTFSLKETSNNFIRKVFNTNPQLTNTTIEDTNHTKSYWLGETYERYVEERVGTSAAAWGAIVAIASASIGGLAPKTMPYRDAHTGWFFGQNLNYDTDQYEYINMTRLFKFVGINGHGEWLQNNIKISISNIKASSNEAVPYGSFDVLLRKISDSDLRPEIVERYSNCNLDPTSMDYVGARIGTIYQTWDNTNKRYREFGTYPNRSDYVRVVISDEIDNNGANPTLLPFGIFGPPRFKGYLQKSSSQHDTVAGALNPFSYGIGSSSVPYYTGGKDYGATAQTLWSANGHYGTASFKFPAVGIRATASDDGALATKNAYFGLQTGKSRTTTLYDPGYPDYIRAFGREVIADSSWGDDFGLSSGFSPYGTNLNPQWVFSLDEVIVTTGSSFYVGSPASNITDAYWHSGSYKGVASWNASSSLGTGSNFENILDSKINRFSSPLWGAFDGLDIKERDPFRNTRIDDSESETGNYTYYTLRRAIETIADPEVLSINAASIPGITNESITKYLIDTCDQRADALAVIDLKGGFQPRHELNDTAANRKGTVEDTIANIKLRNLNSSYGCAYYPWVKVRDDFHGAFIYMPPSVVALGVLANTERSADVWFAPAGFQRGGLSQGAGGVTVIGVETKLTSGNRDDLYDVNINPIASFPAEGIVVFGQKTLQATQSALDRINVRRLMIFVKRGISRIASETIFQPNVQATWNSFKSKADNFLSDVQIRFGVDDFKVVLDETTTTPDLIDRNIMYAKIFIKPTRAIEFIAIDFIITRSGASFED